MFRSHNIKVIQRHDQDLDPEVIAEELHTLKQRVAALVEKYADEYPDLLQNYTLTMLLYVREYETKLVKGAASLAWLIDRAADGEDGRGLVNFTSLHRAITATKKDFQTPAQRRAGLKKEEAYRESFVVDDKGWDFE